MKEFWQFVSILISLAGFLVVAGILLVRGECLLTAAIKAVFVFVALWVAQSVLRALLNFTITPTNSKE